MKWRWGPEATIHRSLGRATREDLWVWLGMWLGYTVSAELRTQIRFLVPREFASCDCCCNCESVYDWQKQTRPVALGLGSVLKLTSDWVTPCWQLLSPLAHTHLLSAELLRCPGPWHWTQQWGIRHRRSRRWGNLATRGPGDPGPSEGCHQWVEQSQHKWVMSSCQKSGHWAQTRSRCDTC